MGHLMLSTMKKIQAALRELTLEQDGVDGNSLYIYGEAWDFGEVSNPAQPSSAHILLVLSCGRSSVQGYAWVASILLQILLKARHCHISGHW